MYTVLFDSEEMGGEDYW